MPGAVNHSMTSSDAPYIVGIGASAGGLDSMLSLFAKLQANGRLTYVVAQHMAHDAHSELIVRLLNRESALPVILAEADQTLQADKIYLVPAGRDGRITERHLSLQPPGQNSLSTPSVNVLFESIAQAAKNRAIGVVLSGAGRDGASGCQAIKAVAGMTIAQAPETAKFNGMPRSAIEARSVDEILSIAGIAERLNTLFSKPPNPATTMATEPAANSDLRGDRLHPLLAMVFEATGVDFSGYKEETLLRRLHKRLSVLALGSVEQYFEYIARNPDELQTLQHLFLVSLSSFFRDPESFAQLEKPLAELLHGKQPGEAIKLWVPGCATGEEVFTLAIMVREILGKRFQYLAVSILGTDINVEALRIAKRGLYRHTAFDEMNPDLLKRYFQEKGQHYEVADALRDFCQFDMQNAIKQAPASGLDLISCRNLLIYMKSHLQDRIIRSFHDALRPNGLLFVGQAESIGVMGNTLFYPVDHYHKIYRRRA